MYMLGDKSMAKPTGYKTISQVSDEYNVPQSHLRYLDRIGVLVPRRIGSFRAYGADDLKKLSYIQRMISEGFRPSEIRTMLIATSIVDDRSISQTRALHELMKNAKRGDVVEQELDLSSYNTIYQRLQRIMKRYGKKGLIASSEDGK